MKKLALLFIPIFFGILILQGCQSDKHHHAKHIELEGLSHTIWTDKTELFVEFDPLIMGEETFFAAHFSKMSDFKSSSGSPSVAILPLSRT